MRRFGFSTGAVALGDFEHGLSLARAAASNSPAVAELSALREPELEPLLSALPTLDLASFSYVSIHAPSRFGPESEGTIAEALLKRAAPYNVVVHPDSFHDISCWRPLGRRLCVENTDKRKPVGRNCHELDILFEQLPEAGFCLDLGHSRQVDPTMGAAFEMLDRYEGRLLQVHLSEVTTNCRHERLSLAAIIAFQPIARMIPDHVPVVIESVIGESPTPTDLQDELGRARRALPCMEGSILRDRHESSPVASVPA